MSAESQASLHREDRTTEFVMLWSEFGRRIFSYIFSLLPNTHDAEEVFSEVSRLMWERFDEYQSGTNFQAWAMRIAYFKVLRYVDDRKRGPAPFDASFFQTVDRLVTERSPVLDAQYRALADCIKHLKPRDQQLLALRYEEGATTDRVAEVTGRTVAAVYKALSRVRGLLFNCITTRLAEEEHQ